MPDSITLSPSRPILFVSDVHLSEQDPALTNLFVDFCQQITPDTQALFILGDLFNVWLGDDIVSEYALAIAEKLLKLKKSGIHTFFMAGNRDFLLGQAFADKAGFVLLNDPAVINIQGKRYLLTHGDLLCTDDVAYQRYRNVAQSKLGKSIFRLLPKRYRQHIAQKLRAKSKSYQNSQPLTKFDATELGVQRMLTRTPADVIIHGHVHRENHFQHQFNGKHVDRYVLGTWHKTGSYIRLVGSALEIRQFG